MVMLSAYFKGIEKGRKEGGWRNIRGQEERKGKREGAGERKRGRKGRRKRGNEGKKNKRIWR